MRLEIITPEKTLFVGQVELLRVPGTMGSFEILNNHAPIISTLSNGIIKIVRSVGEIKYIEIKSGIIEVKNNKIIILAENV